MPHILKVECPEVRVMAHGVLGVDVGCQAFIGGADVTRECAEILLGSFLVVVVAGSVNCGCCWEDNAHSVTMIDPIRHCQGTRYLQLLSAWSLPQCMAELS